LLCRLPQRSRATDHAFAAVGCPVPCSQTPKLPPCFSAMFLPAHWYATQPISAPSVNGPMYRFPASSCYVGNRSNFPGDAGEYAGWQQRNPGVLFGLGSIQLHRRHKMALALVRG
jgi:hypothetical protein